MTDLDWFIRNAGQDGGAIADYGMSRFDLDRGLVWLRRLGAGLREGQAPEGEWERAVLVAVKAEMGRICSG